MKKQFNFLLVEDNELDMEKVERAFDRLKILNPLRKAKNGVEALEILRGTENGIEKPFVILLDLSMPKMNGFEFLKELRSDPEIKDSPVFVLTTSDRQKDIDTAYEFNVAGYIVKPVKREQMIEAFEVLNGYWELCELPGDEE